MKYYSAIKRNTQVGRNLLQLDKEHLFKKPTANTILNSKRLTAFPLKSRTSQEHPLSSVLLTQYWKFWNLMEVTATRQKKKEIKGIEREQSFSPPPAPLFPLCSHW